MTNALFFDTDCLSSFLWVGREDIVLFRYKNRIVIPQFVYEEFCRPGVAHLRQKLDGMIRARLAIKMEIASGTTEAKLFRELAKQPQVGHIIIGKGEASALVLAKQHGGIIASNNLKDVQAYAREFGIKITTTAEILLEVFTDNLISESTANQVWQAMLDKRRKLPAESFSAFLRML